MFLVYTLLDMKKNVYKIETYKIYYVYTAETNRSEKFMRIIVIQTDK